MKVVLLSRYFPPEIGTAASLFFDLARGLVSRGHKVTVITGFPWYNLLKIPEKYKNKVYMVETDNGVKVIRLKIPAIGPTKFKLALGHLTSPIISVLGGLMVKNPDVIFAYSPPLFIALAGWALHLFKGAPFVLGVQDLHPQCYIDQGLLKNKVIIRFWEAIEKFCYRKATMITVHSEGNKDHIVRLKGAKENKVIVIPNWIDTEEIYPIDRDNWFARKYDLERKFVVGYAGTLGMSQGLMSIMEAAYILRERKDVVFFIVGDGIEKDRMVKRAKELGLNNVRFLEMQPKGTYPFVVASCDIGIVTLNARVKTPVVPSKILSLMAAGKPIVASLPLDGDAPKLIEKARCGLCVPPEAPLEIAKAILHLYNNPRLREEFSRNGRKYAIKEFSLNKIVSNLEMVFKRLGKEYK